MDSRRSWAGGGSSVDGSGRLRTALLALLLGLAAAAWAVMMQASFRTLYVEPTDEAVSRAALARPGGIVAAALVVVLVLSAAALVRRSWVAVLALPGVLAGGWLVLAPDAHGAAFLYGLGGSVIAMVVAAVRATAAFGSQRA